MEIISLMMVWMMLWLMWCKENIQASRMERQVHEKLDNLISNEILDILEILEILDNLISLKSNELSLIEHQYSTHLTEYSMISSFESSAATSEASEAHYYGEGKGWEGEKGRREVGRRGDRKRGEEGRGRLYNNCTRIFIDLIILMGPIGGAYHLVCL